MPCRAAPSCSAALAARDKSAQRALSSMLRRAPVMGSRVEFAELLGEQLGATFGSLVEPFGEGFALIGFEQANHVVQRGAKAGQRVDQVVAVVLEDIPP